MMSAASPSSLTITASEPRRIARWAGHVIVTLTGLMLVADAGVKLTTHPAVVAASTTLGIPLHLNLGIALVLLACLGLYLVPRTAVLGAVLLTGYLGGAVAVHLRVGDPLLSHTLFPVYVGAFAWLGLALRDPRIVELFTSTSR